MQSLLRLYIASGNSCECWYEISFQLKFSSTLKLIQEKSSEGTFLLLDLPMSSFFFG